MSRDESATSASESAKASSRSKKGRIAGHARIAREVWKQPSLIGGFLRSAFVRLWVTKGGGFYGLGYVLVFVALEIRSFTSDVGGSETVAGFVTSQIVQYVIRLSVESFFNALQALFWPFFVFEWLGISGLILLGGGYFAYIRLARPFVESWFPELENARLERAQAKAAKAKSESEN